MIRLALWGLVAVAVVIVAVKVTGTVWAYPVALGVGAFGALLVAFDGDGAR